MSKIPKGLIGKRDELVKNYPAKYELIYMNADTPRPSGMHYLTHGFRQGFNEGVKSILDSEELKALAEALLQLNNYHGTTVMGTQALDKWAEFTGGE